MKSFDTLLSRFCYKHPRFGIPNLMTVIVAGTVLVYLLDMFSTTILFSDLLSGIKRKVKRRQTCP